MDPLFLKRNDLTSIFNKLCKTVKSKEDNLETGLNYEEFI